MVQLSWKNSITVIELEAMISYATRFSVTKWPFCGVGGGLHSEIDCTGRGPLITTKQVCLPVMSCQ